jgi:hypothetical protein
MWQDVLVDAANVVVLEFFGGWLLPVGFWLLFVGVFVCFLAEGTVTVWRWRTAGRAAYQKEHFIYNMKMVLREMGSDMRVERPMKRITQPVISTKLKRLEVVKKSLEEKLDDAFPEE